MQRASIAFQVLAAGLALFAFLRACHWLAPGTRLRTRLGFGLLLLGLSPVFASRILGHTLSLPLLAATLAALALGLRAQDFRDGRWAALSACFAGLALGMDRMAGAILLPLLLSIFRLFFLNKQWAWCLAMPAAGVGACFFWEKLMLPGFLENHALFENTGALAQWSLAHFSQKPPDADWPNLVFLAFPFFHPGFFAPLPLLFFAAKKTDFQLIEKKCLLAGLLLFLLLLGGLPRQSLPDLLPAYATLLLLLYPAWDRFVSYGFHFLSRRWMLAALAAFALWQVAFLAKMIV